MAFSLQLIWFSRERRSSVLLSLEASLQEGDTELFSATTPAAQVFRMFISSPARSRMRVRRRPVLRPLGRRSIRLRGKGEAATADPSSGSILTAQAMAWSQAWAHLEHRSLEKPRGEPHSGRFQTVWDDQLRRCIRRWNDLQLRSDDVGSDVSVQFRSQCG